jgi:hypothetical protein
MLGQKLRLANLLAIAAMSGVAQAESRQAPPPRIRLPQPRTDLEREIAEHNAAVDRAKAEKRANRRGCR